MPEQGQTRSFPDWDASTKQPGALGPHRLAPKDIEETFSKDFAVNAIAETVYQGTLEPQPLALFCTLQRK